MSVDISASCDCQQPKISKTIPSRHLDHLIDLQEGVKYTQIPRALETAWLDGFMPDTKYKILHCLLSHGESFNVKRKYLENRFGKSSLSKYIPELEAEGFIRREQFQLPEGGTRVIYHTNRISMWQIPTKKPDKSNRRSSCSGGYKVDDRPASDTPTQDPLNETNPLNETKNLNPHTQDPEPAILPHQKLAHTMLEKLSALGVRGNSLLMGQTMGLINQNLGWSWTTIESRLDEISLFVAAREESSQGDCSQRVWAWARNWKAPQEKPAHFVGKQFSAKKESNYKKAPIATVTAPPWVCTMAMFDEWVIRADQSAIERIGKISGVSREERLEYFQIISEKEFETIGFTRDEFFSLHFPRKD